MQFEDQSVDVSGVDDQRGGGGRGVGGPIAIGGGGVGIVGLLIYVLVSVLGGGSSGLDPSQLVPGAGQVQEGGSGGTSDLKERCNTEGAIDKYEDCFLIRVYNEINDVWDAEFSRRGAQYRPPRLAFFEQAVGTGCGEATSQVGPFYCPPDERIYLDIGFLDQLQQQFGAQGRFAQAYILGHEAGHHLQTLLGTERRMRALQQQRPDQANPLSVKLELQADCYAGVWSTLANQAGDLHINDADLDEALNAAAAVGDDRIQQQTQGRVDRESFTHGSAAQRKRWFQQGSSSGDLNRCDTFA